MKLYAKIKAGRGGREAVKGDDTRLLIELSYGNKKLGTIGFYAIIDDKVDGYRIVYDKEGRGCVVDGSNIIEEVEREKGKTKKVFYGKNPPKEDIEREIEDKLEEEKHQHGSKLGNACCPACWPSLKEKGKTQKGESDEYTCTCNEGGKTENRVIWTKKNYREQGNPVCPYCDDEMILA